MWQLEHSLALPFFGIGMKTDLFINSQLINTFQRLQPVDWDCPLRHSFSYSFPMWLVPPFNTGGQRQWGTQVLWETFKCLDIAMTL